MATSLPKISVAHEEVFYENPTTQYRFQILAFVEIAVKYANITRFYKKPSGGGWAPTKKQISFPVPVWAELERNFASFSATVKSYCGSDDATVPSTNTSNKENLFASSKSSNQGMNLSCNFIF